MRQQHMPVFSGNSIQKIDSSRINKVVITDSILLSKDKLIDKLAIVSVANLLSDAIIRIHNNLPVDELFNKNFK